MIMYLFTTEPHLHGHWQPKEYNQHYLIQVNTHNQRRCNAVLLFPRKVYKAIIFIGSKYPETITYNSGLVITGVNQSFSFIAETSVTSPWELFIFIIKKWNFWIKVSNKTFHLILRKNFTGVHTAKVRRERKMEAALGKLRKLCIETGADVEVTLRIIYFHYQKNEISGSKYPKNIPSLNF